ncbi:chemotaxis protein CheA [Tunturibacter empetritectus]|uniref:histidine kinase n=1 Tax=Tunturiibacter empetritectus TaxID=3069691 RepID=A0A7W8IGV4_9BACT|nr:chemotaxis protein CheA [Edaphobacter lichenicola]MBB5316131.1 two-component system chemotaxis sensor kinase CheA [Edaphobacter lichenicola]
MDELTKEFIAESQEGLDRMERCLTELEMRPDDTGLLGEIFRAVHTIKGTTGFLGFDRLEKLAHAGEHLLGSLRDGRLAVTSDLISGLLRLMDGLRSILMLIEETGSEGTRAGDEDGELIAELASLNGQVPAELPEIEAPQIALVETTKSEGAAPAASNGGASPVLQPTVVTEKASADKTLRIDVDVLNRMMNLVGELVLTRNQMLQSGMEAANFPELARRLDSVTADLRETVMQARMQPVGNLFGKFPRMVRDLARTCGREVRVEFSGQETGLDKSLLEAIKDPLTHAVRNAVDHGIESPADRVLAGKSAEGCLRLKAFHQSGSVVIEIEDDGAGIPIERVLEKAIERNLVTAEDAAGMSEREALQLIFLPGFSTAAAVTTVSGRGVGMDVVRANVEKVGGSVEVESRRGVGTTLRLRVPLTLAIVPSLVVKSGGQAFALPQSTLVELVDIPEREFAQVVQRIGSSELYRLRERLLPMVWLDRLLGLEADNPDQSKGHYLAVLEAEGCRYGLVVDDLMSPEEIVVKPLSPVLREIGLFSGATVLGNGTLALILDIGATAARAGVKPIEEEVSGIGAGEAAVLEGAGISFLIFEDRVRERTALPLDVVERIESVPLGQIEYAGGRPLLQYRGELLPLRDEGSVLMELESARQAGEETMVTILICGDAGVAGAQRGGMVVRQVLDVSTGTLIDQGEATQGMELALVKEKLTQVHREFGVKAKAAWQEVA